MYRSKFKNLISVALLLLCCGGATVALAGTPSGGALDAVFTRMGQSEALRGSVWGFTAVTSEGDTLVNLNGGVRMLPASNLKLVTTGAALCRFGGPYRFNTSISCTGDISEGMLHGDLYIVGGGDPSLCDHYKSTGEQSTTFAEWLSFLKQSGISSIEGSVVGDARHFNGADVYPDWGLDDICEDYSSVAYGLNFADNLNLASEGFPTLVKAPYCCADSFAEYLRANGISVGGGASEDASVPGDSLKCLGTTCSVRLSEIISVANHESENVYAEALFRQMGKDLYGTAAYDTSALALSAVLRDMGLGGKLGDVQIRDGSGLSRKNFVTPDFLVSFLLNMAGRNEFPQYLQSIPRPGEGTLKNRLASQSPELKSRVYMKSGTMTGVRCFSGYIMPSDPSSGKMIAFSLMTNNTLDRKSALPALLDAMIVRLAAEN